MHLRDAVTPPPHLPAVLRVGASVAALTAIVLTGALVALGPRVESPLPAITIPHVTPAVATAGELALVQREVRAYAFEAYPSWAAAHPERTCPARLLELNVYDPSLHAVDPWGTPYQFLCGEQWGMSGTRVRSAGPDGAFDTADDIASH